MTAEDHERPVPPRPPSAPPPRFDLDDEYDTNGWDRESTWERRPR